MACDNPLNPNPKLLPVVWDPVTNEIRPLKFGEAMPDGECDPCGKVRDFAIPTKQLQDAYYQLYKRLKALEEKYCNCVCGQEECPECPECPEPEPCDECPETCFSLKFLGKQGEAEGSIDPVSDPYKNADFVNGPYSGDARLIIGTSYLAGPLPAGYHLEVEYEYYDPLVIEFDYSAVYGGYLFTVEKEAGGWVDGGSNVTFYIRLVRESDGEVCSQIVTGAGAY